MWENASIMMLNENIKSHLCITVKITCVSGQRNKGTPKEKIEVIGLWVSICLYVFWYQFLLFAPITYFCPTPKKEKEFRPLEFASLCSFAYFDINFSMFSGKDMTILSWKQTPDEASSILLPVGGKRWKQILKGQINPALALRAVNNGGGGRELRFRASEFQDCLPQAHLK